MRHRRNDMPMSQEDREFFDGFLVKYHKFIWHIVIKYQCADVPWDDIYQETTIKLIHEIPKLRKMGHNGTCAYISRTVQSAFSDLLRKENRHTHVFMDVILEETIGKEHNLVPDLFIRHELRRLRKSLTPREWLALKGKYVFGYSQEELGRQLGMAPDSVRMLLCRGRERARQILSPEKVTGGDGDD